jgi:hypothetical protein
MCFPRSLLQRPLKRGHESDEAFVEWDSTMRSCEESLCLADSFGVDLEQFLTILINFESPGNVATS